MMPQKTLLCLMCFHLAKYNKETNAIVSES